jgi:hypothetical protein
MLATIDTAFTSPLRVFRSDVSQIDLGARLDAFRPSPVIGNIQSTEIVAKAHCYGITQLGDWFL